jgi:hypothetical protein
MLPPNESRVVYVLAQDETGPQEAEGRLDELERWLVMGRAGCCCWDPILAKLIAARSGCQERPFAGLARPWPAIRPHGWGA